MRLLGLYAGVLGLSCLTAALVFGVRWSSLSAAQATSPPSDPVVPVQDGERLAWDQWLRGPTVAQDYRFVLYVDGRAARLDDVVCEPTATRHLVSCSTRLPALAEGRHVLQLAAVVGVEERPRSDELAVRFARSPVGGDSAWSNAPGGAPCLDAARECYDVETIARLNSEISLPTPSPDGRLLLVDRRRHVRVVEGGTLLPEPALSMDRATDRIVGLGVDSAFADTRAVFVAWIEEPVPGQRTLSVARYRDVRNQFGQGAVVLTGIPLPASLEPRVAFDDLNRIYVAVPRPAPPAVRGPYDGALLRFSPAGTVPWASGQVSPVLAASYDRPSAMAASSATRSTWIAGRNNVGDPEVRVVSWPGQPALGYESLNTQARGVAVSAGTGPAAADIISVAVDGSDPGEVRAYLVDGSGRLSRAIVDERGGVGVLRALSFLPGPVVAVAAAAPGGLYAVVRSDTAGSGVFSVVRLSPGNGR